MNLAQRESLLFKDLRPLISELQVVNPLQGLARIVIIGSICLLLTYLAWFSANLITFAILTIFAGIFYAFLLICTHDAIHHTLTGWRWFDEIIARIISYPILWAVGTYSELHDLHHGWNGINLKDPERVQLTESEYDNLSLWQKWLFPYEWLLNIFVGGSLGLITKAFYQGWKHQSNRANLRQQLIIDVTGMIMIHSILLWWIISHNLLWKYLLFWLIIERSVGVIVQTRDHLEHYGKWSTFGRQQLTQLYATRNLQTNPVVSWLMGGLDYHGVHHAFPRIPFYRLPKAYSLIQDYLKKYDLPPMSMDEGYLKTTLRLSKKPEFIK